MEQIIQILYVIVAFFHGFYWGRFYPIQEKIVFLHCNHGFENPEDCRRYVEGDKK